MKATLLILGLLFANLSLAQEKWDYCVFNEVIASKLDMKVYHIKTSNNEHITWITIKDKHTSNPAKEIKALKENGIDIDITNTGNLSSFKVVSALGQVGWELVSTQSTKRGDMLESSYWFKRKSK